jgi:hypothetical protein
MTIFCIGNEVWGMPQAIYPDDPNLKNSPRPAVCRSWVKTCARIWAVSLLIWAPARGVCAEWNGLSDLGRLLNVLAVIALFAPGVVARAADTPEDGCLRNLPSIPSKTA